MEEEEIRRANAKRVDQRDKKTRKIKIPERTDKFNPPLMFL
jgi:hypothetical protein